MRVALALLAILPSVALCQEESADTKFVARLEGRWAITKVQVGGQLEEKKVGTVFVFTKDMLEVVESGNPNERNIKYTVDAKQTPVALDLTVAGDKKVEGIIGLDDGTLKIAFIKGGGAPRPNTFTPAEVHPELVQIELRREAKK